MGKDVNLALIFGLGALGLGVWCLLTQKKGKGAIAELADVIQAQNPNMSRAEAEAAAAARLAQEAVTQAQTAADANGVPEAADTYTDAEGNNGQAQTDASSNPTDQAAAEAARRAAEEAARARAELEARFNDQLRIVEDAAARAKGALQVAMDSYNTAVKARDDYRAYVNQHCSDPNIEVAHLWKDANQGGSVKSLKLGDTRLSDFNDCASSYSVLPGFKLTLFKHIFSGDAFPVYGINAINRGNLSGFNDCASSARVIGYPEAYSNNINEKQAVVDRIRAEVISCQGALNDCIERVESLLDQYRMYAVLSARISTSESSLVALRNYVGSIRV